MAKRLSLPEFHELPTFILFDAKIKKNEGFVTPVFYYEPKSVFENTQFPNNFAGLLLTFIQLTRKFNENEPCNYIRTEKHEISLLELSNDVWFAFCREYTDEHNLNILQSTLLTCRNIYNLFFEPPKRDANDDISRFSIYHLKSGFEMIVSSITWGKRAFVHLFNSYFQSPLSESIHSMFQSLISDIEISHKYIQYLLIMQSKDVIYSTFPTDVTRTLTICFSLKLSYLFPKIIEKEEKKLYWIIGPCLQGKHIEIYAPPITIDNEQYPIVALKMKKIKFILALKSNVVPTPYLLQKIPRQIHHLVFYSSRITVQHYPGKWIEPYVIVENIPRIHMISINHANLSDLTIVEAENAIFKSHLLADNYSSKNSCILYPENKEYTVYVVKKEDKETISFFRLYGTVSQGIAVANQIKETGNIKTQNLIIK